MVSCIAAISIWNISSSALTSCSYRCSDNPCTYIWISYNTFSSVLFKIFRFYFFPYSILSLFFFVLSVFWCFRPYFLQFFLYYFIFMIILMLISKLQSLCPLSFVISRSVSCLATMFNQFCFHTWHLDFLAIYVLPKIS